MMFYRSGFAGIRRFAQGLFFPILLLTGAASTAQETASALLMWGPNFEPDIAGYAVYYGGASRQYSTRIPVGNVTNHVASGLTRGATYYFALTAYNTAGLESDFSNEVAYTPPALPPVNSPPTLDPIANIVLTEDSSALVAFTGVGAGGSEAQPLTVTATSSNPALIPTPAINYTSPNATGNLTLRPVSDLSGSSVITVFVNDDQTTNNVVSRSFIATVTPVNDPPQFDPIPDLVLTEDSEPVAVAVTGITAGPNESQSLTLTASSSRPDIMPHPAVSYSSAAASGTLTLFAVPNTNGLAVMTVSLSDGAGINGTFTRTFAVTVNSSNDPPVISAIPDQVIAKNRTSAPIPFAVMDAETAATELVVEVQSSDLALIPEANIIMSGAGSERTLIIEPANGREGDAIVTVRLGDGSAVTSTSFLVSVRSGVQ